MFFKKEDKIPKGYWSRIWRLLLVFLCSLILILLVSFFLFRGAILRWAIKEWGRRRGIEVVMKEVGGTFFYNLSVSDLRVVFPNGITFTTRSFKVRYNPISLLKGKKEIASIFLEEPEIFMPKGRGKGPVNFSSPKGDTSFKAFPLSLRVQKAFIKKGRLFFLDKLGAFDFTGQIIFVSGRVAIVGGKITTNQGKIDFSFEYDFISQNGNLDIPSLVFTIADKSWQCSAQGHLIGKFAFSLRDKGIMGMPKINGGIKIFLSPFSFRDFTFVSCSLDLKIPDTLLSYRFRVFSQELGFLQSEGCFYPDTSYNFHLSLFTFDLKKLGDLLKINIPIQKVSGELGVKGKGRKEMAFSSDFQILDLGDTYFRIMGKVSAPFDKKVTVIVKEGKVNRKGESFSFAGKFERSGFHINFFVENFLLKKKDVPFGLLGEITAKVNGFGEVKRSFDSLSVKGFLAFSSFVWTNLSIASCSLSLNFPNIFNLNGEGKAKGERLDWNKRQFDSLILSWQKKNINLLIFKSQDTTLEARLNLEFFSLTNFSLFLERFRLRLGVDSIFNLQDFAIERVGNVLSLKDLAIGIGGGEINGNLIFLPGEHLRGELAINNLLLEKITKSDKIQGKINGSIFLDTVVISQMVIEELLLPGENIRINDLQMEIKLKNDILNFQKAQELELTNISFVNQGKTSHLSGHIIISQGKVDNCDILAVLNDPGPLLFLFLKNTLHLQEGKIFGKVRLRGNLSNPIFDGRLRIYDGKLFFPAFRLLVNDFSSELSLYQDEIALLEGKGKVDNGTITGSGFVNLKGLTKVDTLHYDIEFSQMPLNLAKDIFGIFAGRVAIDWAPSSPLWLSGNLSVIEGLVNVSFGQKVSRGASGGGVDFDFKVEGNKGIWLRNQNADLELGIDLRVRKKGGEMTLTGELSTRRGQLYYLDRTLQMKEGKIIFDNISEIDPQLNLQAELETKPIKVGENFPQRFKIIFLLQGTLSQPEFKLLSEPPFLSESDIITYFTLNVSPEDLKSISEREFFYSVLSERILSYFEREVAKKLRGYLSLDYLSLEQGLTEKGTKITVGKYVARNLYLTYSAVMAGKERDEYKAEYYLTRQHLISAEKTAEGRYRVKYQFQIRY